MHRIKLPLRASFGKDLYLVFTKLLHHLLSSVIVILTTCIAFVLNDNAISLNAQALVASSATATFSPLLTPTNTATPIPTPVTVVGTLNRNANLRAGPGIGYTKVGLARAGTTVTILGTSAAGDWYRLVTGEWIAAFLVDNSSAIPLGIVAEEQAIADRPLTPTATTVQAATATPESVILLDCQRPPDNMTLVKVNGETVSMRTYWMLQLAQAIYGGPGSVLRVVQGSYEPGLAESFGTHDAGGAVDISIRNPANPAEILWDEATKMAVAMRKAGFAAWYRPTGMFGPGSGAHIHAIAIGDPELSQAARDQLDGPSGYFRGLDGVHPMYGGPSPDPHGGPIICQWMRDIGYDDLR